MIRSFLLLGLLWASTALALGGTISGKVTVPKGEDPSQAVVYVEGTFGSSPPPSKPLEMANVELEFAPRMLVVSKGATVNFPNRDPVTHNIYSSSKSNPFDLGLYRKGEARTVTLKNAGIVEVGCHIHAQMTGTIFVLDTPHFTRVSKDGNFSIPNVPKGSFHAVAAMNESTRERKPVTIKGNETVTVTFSLR